MRVLRAASAAVLVSSGLLTLNAGGATAAGASTGHPLAPLIGPSISAATSAATPASVSAASAGRPVVVPNSYIVVLKDAAGLRQAGLGAGTPAARAQAAVVRGMRTGATIGHTYTGVFQGYSATLTSTELNQVRQDRGVQYVQQNLQYRLAATTQKHLQSWGLDRIDQRNRPINGAYYYNATGRGVTAYVVDTGIEGDHPDFEHIGAGIDLIGSSGDGAVDCNGHGTHVAGTIGGTRFGVAKTVSLVPVRVLDCQGAGEQDDILAGLDWIGQHHAGPSVVNLSIETTDADFDTTLNTAVTTLIHTGVTVVAAAGNDSASACTVSPASVPEAITVGASTIKDRAASFSNYGACVDLYAPGEGITSDWPKNSRGVYRIATLDGTSMAAPHVTGTVALYLEKHPAATPDEASAFITSTASANRISGASSSTTRRLLFAPQPVTAPAGVTTGDRLLPGQSLLRGARLYSPDQGYFLAHRAGDGWLCLYQASSGKVVWSSGHSGVWTNLNTRGSLSSYDSYGRRAWSTSTPAGASTMLVSSQGYIAIKRISDGRITWTSPH